MRLSRSAARLSRRSVMIGAAALAAPAALSSGRAEAKTAAEINSGVNEALEELFAVNPGARSLYNDARGVLVIPEIVKAGFVLGGAYGEGALQVNRQIVSYWSYGAASVGLQIGAQKTRQVLFFMTEDALSTLRSGEKAEVGADFEVTVIDAGAEAALDTTQATKPVIAMVYGRQGLLAGASLAGGGYTRIIR